MQGIAAMQMKGGEVGHHRADDPGRVSGRTVDDALNPAQHPDRGPPNPFADRGAPHGDHGHGDGQRRQDEPEAADHDREGVARNEPPMEMITTKAMFDAMPASVRVQPARAARRRATPSAGR